MISIKENRMKDRMYKIVVYILFFIWPPPLDSIYWRSDKYLKKRWWWYEL